MIRKLNHKAIGLFCLYVSITVSCNLFQLPERPATTPPTVTHSPTEPPVDMPTLIPTDTPLPPPAPIETGEPVVSLLFYPVEGGAAYIGRQLQVVLEAIPELLTITHKSDGSVESVSSAWTDFTVSEMQVCFSFDVPCQLSGPWTPFTLSPDSVYLGGSARLKYSFIVDWIGPRILYAVAQFRDGQGQSIPSFATTFSSNQPVVVSQISMQIDGVWNEATPVFDQPAPVQTAIAATKTAFPVTGSVILAGGASATGGIAGETLQVQAAFKAASPDGAVTRMRIKQSGTCRTDQIQMEDAAWEPFASTRTFSVSIALNWIGFYVAVQYQDDKGNLSPVYCDDISVEGMPPTTVTAP
jgi:hypothetical protein